MVKMFHATYTAVQRQCYRSILSTNKVKHNILRYLLKSVNTLMQKTGNVMCSEMMMMMMMGFLRRKQEAKKDFYNLLGGYKTNNK